MSKLRSSITGRYVADTWWRRLPVIRWFYVSERPTRYAIRAEETPVEIMEALAAADYSHLEER